MEAKSRRRLRKKTPKIDLLTLNQPIDEVGLSISLLASLKKLEIKNLIDLKNKLKEKKIPRKAIGALGWEEINRIFKKSPIN